MIANSPETQEVLSYLVREKDNIMASIGTPISNPAFSQFKFRFFSVVKSQFPGEDFVDWLTLVVDPSMQHIDVKLNHHRMVEDLAAVPDWVYFVLWTFNPNYAPTKQSF
jgi:hypothetical protein